MVIRIITHPVFNNFKKTVDLAKLIVHGTDYFSVYRKNSHINQRWDHGSLFQQIFLFTVMGFLHFCCTLCLLFTSVSHLSLFRDQKHIFTVAIPGI